MSLTPAITIALKESFSPQTLSNNLQKKLENKNYKVKHLGDRTTNWPGKGKIPNSSFDLHLDKWGDFSQIGITIYSEFISCWISDSIHLGDLLSFVNTLVELLKGDLKFVYGQWSEGMAEYQQCVQKKNQISYAFPSEYFDFECLIKTHFWFFYFDQSLLSKSELKELEEYSKREHKIEYLKDGVFVVHKNFFEFPERSLRYFYGDDWKKKLKG